MTFPADSFEEAVNLSITASNQLHTILNGDSTTEVIVADGSKIPSVRKAYTDSLFFLSPQPWVVGEYETVYNQLRAFVEPTGITTWWFSKPAAVSTPILMPTTPHEDSNWTLWNAINNSVYETQKRLAAEAGLNMVGSFLLGATVTTTDDVVFYETDGKYYGWGGVLPKTVTAGSTPATAGGIGAGAWVDRTDLMLRYDVMNVCKNIYFMMSDSQKQDSKLPSPTLDYTDLLNSAFLDASTNNYTLIIDSHTNLRITQPLNTVSNLNLQLDGNINCDMSDISSVYIGGNTTNIFGAGSFNGLGNNIRRFVRSPLTDDQSGIKFRISGADSGRLKFKNASSLLFHRSIDIFDEGVDFEIKNIMVSDISAVENGIIGDINGSCRAVYFGGSTTGANQSYGNIDDILVKNLLPFEDGDAVHLQSNNTANFNVSVSNVKGYNVAKRIVKVQLNGVDVKNIVARAESNNVSMYSVVSMYGSGQVINTFGTGKIMNGVDAFNTVGKTLIFNTNIQSTQSEDQQQACVTAAGGDVEINGVYGFGCFYALFARSVSGHADYRVSNISHKAKNYAARLLSDSAYPFNSINLIDSKLDSSSTSLPSVISAGTIGSVSIDNIVANTSYFVGVSLGHTGKVSLSNIKVPNCGSHGVEILSTVSGGGVNGVSVVGSSAAHACIIKCANMFIENLMGGSYSTLRFDGASATSNKASNLILGAGSTRPYEEINSATGNIVSCVSPLTASITYDAPSVAAGGITTTTVTVSGANIGDSVTVNMPINTQGLNVFGWVGSSNTVSVSLQNPTASPIDLGSVTLKVFVRKQ